MSIDIKHSTERQFKKPKGGVTYFSGVALSDLLDYLTELQANGVPDNACISAHDLYAKVSWVEKR
jgi:hypothetical protein